jgi:hypothetical protein
MQKHCIRSIKMYPDEWEKLEQLAVETGSRPTDGPHARLCTWPALLRRIARGELQIVAPKADPRIAAIDRAIAENERTAKRLEQRQQGRLFETEPA